MMKEKKRMNKQRRIKYIIYSFVCLIFGFILSYSYSQSKISRDANQSLTTNQKKQEDILRKELLEKQEKTVELEERLIDTQLELAALEKELFLEKEGYPEKVDEVNKYRLFLGKINVKGQGVEVTLTDGDFVPSENVNDYLVHEQHVFAVVNELYISGAKAIAINGQRIHHGSYIVCSGPVITVDGNPFPAPFVISAIGDSDVMTASLELQGGIRDQLVNENITFKLEKKKQLMMNAISGDMS